MRDRRFDLLFLAVCEMFSEHGFDPRHLVDAEPQRQTISSPIGDGPTRFAHRVTTDEIFTATPRVFAESYFLAWRADDMAVAGDLARSITAAA